MIGTCKIDKLLVDPSHRGKGLCPQVINKLLTYAFDKLPVHTVELNVFDWNTAGIRCYERSGFSVQSRKDTIVSVRRQNVDRYQYVDNEREIFIDGGKIITR